MADTETLGDYLYYAKQRILNIQVSTHLVAGIAATIGLLWASNQDFRSQVLEIFHSMPPWLQSLISVGVMISIAYKKVHKATTITAEVQPGDTGEVKASAEVTK